MRFSTTSNTGGKPVIFWEEQSNKKASKKKFGYKDKGLKIPLRSTQQVEPEKDVQKPKKPVDDLKENKIQRNIAAVNNKSSNPKSNSKVQGKGDGKRRPPASDKVTLTQGQFDKILETIGELTLLAEDKENTDGYVSYTADNVGKSNVPALQVSHSFNIDDDAPLPETTPLATPVPTKEFEYSREQIQPGQQQLLAQNTTPQVPKLDITSPRYYDPRSVPQGPVTGNTRASALGVPLAHLTKAERKRIEWERERAEQEEIQKRVQHTEKLHAAGNFPSQHPSAQTSQPVIQQQSQPVYVQQTVNSSTFQQPSTSNYSTVPSLTKPQQPVTEPTEIPGLSILHSRQASSNIPPSQPINSEVVSGNHLQQSQHILQSNPVSVPGLATQPAQSQSGTLTQQATTSKPPLSKYELKRMKWEKERAEQANATNWDPWGRPGAGAPVKGTDGHILTDYSTRRSVETDGIPIQHQPVGYYNNGEIIRQSFEQQQQVPVAAVNNQNIVPPPAQVAVQQAPQQIVTAVPQQQQVTMAGQSNVEPPPAAIRSSFNIGAVAPDENKYQSAKQRQRQQWLADLEKQREEDRLRKQMQLQKDQDLDRKDAMYLAAQSEQVSQQIAQQYQATATGNLQQQQYQQHAQLQQQQQTLLQQPQQQQQTALVLPSQGNVGDEVPDTFIRGQNVYIDPATKRELEEKRQKQIEYQEYIKQQMEEKEMKKKLERERKWKEEIEEEKKLQKERDEIQAQLDKEHGKVRQKQESEKKRTEVLKLAIDEQKERAEWEKHEKRMMKLRQGGHDISQYHSTFQAEHTPREAKHTPREGMASVMTVAPSFVPGLGNIDHVTASQQRDNAPSQQTSYPSPAPLPVEASYEEVRSYRQEPYTENRVLTPSLYRSGNYGHHGTTGREFGVQADLIGESFSRESTAIEFKGPMKKKVRVKSAAEHKASKESKQKQLGFGSTYSKSAEPPKSAPVKTVTTSGKANLKPILKNKKPVPISKRPAWGQHGNKSQKKVVKQSERDPFYDIKKQRNESTKAVRQQMLLELAEQEAPRVSQKSTKATRARSRSHGPDDVYNIEEFTQPKAVHVATTNTKTGERIRVHSRSRSRSPGAVPKGHDSRVDYSVWSRTSNRSVSPPVPALKHKIGGSVTPVQGKTSHRVDPDYNVENYNYDSYRGGQRVDSNKTNKYLDYDVVEAPVQNGQFVPFIRSTNVLDPAHAEDPMPVSREPSMMTKARHAYVQEHEPAKYGTVMENFDDKRIFGTVPPQAPHNYNKDPIINPGLVKDHPSQRQNKILQQLSDLRKGLRQKQLELEVGLQPEEVMG